MITSHHQRGDERIRAVLDAKLANEVGVTIVTVEEQLRGRLRQIHRAKTSEQRVQSYAYLRMTTKYFANMRVEDFGSKADERYQILRRDHPRLGTQDLRIAAIALVHGATVVTRNRVDFEQIRGLSVEDWIA